MGSKISLVMLSLGVGLLWPVPLGGALVLVAAAVGLAICWEADLEPVAVAPVPATIAVGPTGTDD